MCHCTFSKIVFGSQTRQVAFALSSTSSPPRISLSLSLSFFVPLPLSLPLFREVEDYMSEKVQFVVTSEGWHDSFEDVSVTSLLFPSKDLLMLNTHKYESAIHKQAGAHSHTTNMICVTHTH